MKKDVMHRIEQKQYRKVALLPFMFVAGDRAKMTWQEMRIPGNVSWKKPDMKFVPILRGLGELPGIRQISWSI